MIRPDRFRLAVLVLCGGATLAPVASGQESWGKLRGSVTDASGSVIPGAYVALRSGSNSREHHTTTNEQGAYHFSLVPGGLYTVTVVAPGFHTLNFHNLEIKLGAQVTFNARLSLGSIAEVIEVNDVVPLDFGSSATTTTITAAEFQSLPRGRNFHTVLMMAPGVRREVRAGATGVGGFQVDGASGSENVYYIDGVEVSDLVSGALRIQNSIPFEFVNQVQVKSGGFEAEFGGATGGVMNVATRSGGNAFHGEAVFSATGHGLNAGDRGFYQRSVLDANSAEFFRPPEDNYRVLFPGISAGGPMIRDRLFWFGSYMPEFERTLRPIAYPSGTRTFEQTRTRHYGLARLDYSPLSKLQTNASYVWSPMRRQGALPSRDTRLAAPENDVALLGEYLPSQTFSGNASYSATSRLLFDIRFGYNYHNNKLSSYGLSGSPAVVYRTASANAPGVPPEFAGGNGFQKHTGTYGIHKDVTVRRSVNAGISYVTAIAGQQHTFKFGYSLNSVSNDIDDGFTNGRFDIYWGDAFNRGAFEAAQGRYGYYIFQDGPRHLGRVRGRNHGLYAQDNWRVHPRVTLNLGVRFEREYLPPYKSSVNGVRVANPVSFDWGEKIAPRLGAAWDLLGDGGWKLSGSYGLFYDVMKYALARASFGGEYWMSHVYSLDDPNTSKLSRLHPEALGAAITSFDNRSVPINDRGELSGIDPALKPFAVREITLALDRAFFPRLEGGIRYTRKSLLRTIEDIGVLGPNDSETYVIGNPGFGLTRDPASPYGQRTPDGREWLFPRATRQYDALELRLQGEAARFLFLGSYTWSRLFGNYAGLANSDEAGRSDPSISRSFDLPFYYFDSSGSQRNREGRLATDRPHTFKVFGSYELGTRLGQTTAGLMQVAMSGALDSTTVNYLTAPTFPFGRGDLGRLPVFTQTDVSLSHTFHARERTQVRVEANILNVLNQAAVISRVTNINRTGSISAARLPVTQFFSGYDLAEHVGKGPGTPAYNPIYGLPGGDPNDGGVGLKAGSSDYSSAFLAQNPGFGAYQAGRSIRLSLRFIF